MTRSSRYEVQKKLRERGLVPLYWPRTKARLEAAGIPVEYHVEAGWSERARDLGAQDIKQEKERHWAEHWAAMVAEADCSEEAVMQALKRAATDEGFRNTLDALCRLSPDLTKLRMDIINIVVDAWEPAQPEQRRVKIANKGEPAFRMK